VNEEAVDHRSGVATARVPDVRSVPLALVAEDAAVQEAVSNVKKKVADPARVGVAAFNSGI